TEGKQDLVAKIPHLEDVQKCLKHRTAPARSNAARPHALLRPVHYSAGPAPSSALGLAFLGCCSLPSLAGASPLGFLPFFPSASAGASPSAGLTGLGGGRRTNFFFGCGPSLVTVPPADSIFFWASALNR